MTGVAGTGIWSPGYVVLSGGVVTDLGQGPPPRPADVVLNEGTLVPGFVDLQVNGYFGVELATAGPASWATVAGRLPETGTTAFLPTFITAPLDHLEASLRTAAVSCGSNLVASAATAAAIPASAANAGGTTTGAITAASHAGARVLGVHLEGPFIAASRRGAHNPAWIIDPAPGAIDRLLTAGGGLVRLVTLAPELPGGLAAIAQLSAAGVLPSVGHSDATAAQVARAADQGARMVTHLFNAQRPLHHREPGVVGQALADERLTSGLIADRQHVSAPACRIAFAAAPGRIALVTDAAACAGMPAGQYLLGGEPIELPPGAGQPPVRADGTLAGSALRMDTAVANMVAAGVALPEAVAAATRVPADLIGCPRLGRIAPGALGDLVWLGPDLQARATWIAGQQVFGMSRS